MAARLDDIRYSFGGLEWPVRLIVHEDRPEEAIVGHPECPDHGPDVIDRSLGTTVHLVCSECGRGGPFMGDDMDEVRSDVGRWAIAEHLYADDDPAF
ncbi:MAG: hypothetical protein JSW25_07115 [Thermoplasmata archaeon]|nr:MAG: hypothetical protein JSW25_07115 [Thermoplasmata archaeon]